MRLRSALAGAVGLVGLAGVWSPAAADGPSCLADESQIRAPVTGGNPVMEQLDLREAQELVAREAPRRQRPVGVAVLDSGVRAGESIPVAGAHSVTGGRAVDYYHGTVVAGLIAGADGPDDQPIGIAPDAAIYDVRVYDTDNEDEGQLLTSDSLAAGLEWVAANAERLNIRIANVSLVADDTRRLEKAVRAVRKADVVVVASSGNRPQEGELFDESFEDGGPGPGEDAVGTYFPTSYDDVVSVSSTADGSGDLDPTGGIVMNSNTTVAVPTYGAVSIGLNTYPCQVDGYATSWAAAEVSGILALIWQLYPDDTDEQVVARLVNTANGTPDDPTPLIGAGVVQPLEALTRPLDPAKTGEVERTATAARDTAPAVAPEPDEDLLAAAREDAVWWGLIGGGVLVVALLLRPVIARRRT